VLVDGPEIQEDAAAIRRPVMVLQDGVVGHVEIPDVAVVYPLLRDVGEADLAHLGRGQIRHILAVHDDFAAGDRLQAHDGLGQGALPIARRHPRYA